jgi:pimeloyl-ACP methyl ester carboxylesterase
MKLLAHLRHNIFKRPYKLTKIIDTGSGKNVLLIHGLATDSNTWKPLADMIDKSQYHVLAYDLLGFGKSPKPTDKKYDINDHANSLLASLDRKFKRKKFIIIGHSMGCLVASHIATHYPKLVERVILYEPPLFADSPELRSHARRKKLHYAFYKELLKRPNAVFRYSKIVAKLAENRALSVNKDSWFTFERSLKNTIMKQQAYTELKRICVPTDIIYGKYDFLVTRKQVTKALKSNPYITLHLVKEMHDITNRASRYIIKIMKPLY